MSDVAMGFTENRQGVLDAIYRMGVACCSYSGGDKWADFCDCKYGVATTARWPTLAESGNGCPEFRSLHGVIQSMTDEEWALLVRRGGGTPRGWHLGGDDLGARLMRAEAAAARAGSAIGEIRAALATDTPGGGS